MERYSRPRRGFGLVEIMIAMVLGLLLIAAAIQVFLGTGATYRYNRAMAEIQGAARFATHVLVRDLRLAGYTGCPSVPADLPPSMTNNPYGTVRVISEQAIDRGIDASNLLDDALAAPDEQIPDSADSDSDALRLAFMRDYGVRVAGPANSLDADLKSSGNPGGWEAEDQLLVTDCRRADLFAATGVAQSGGIVTIAHASNYNTGNKLGKIYPEVARVLEPYAAVYYVGGEGGLYRKQYFAETAGTASYSELVPGVSGLIVRYGVDVDGDRAPDAYRGETQIESNGEWADVVAVRIAILVRSSTRAAGDSARKTFQLLGETVQAPDDGRLRRTFTVTATLRNRVP